MKVLTEPLQELEEFGEIEKKLRQSHGVTEVTGCIDSQKLHLIYGLGQNFTHRLIVTGNELRAKEFYEDYRFYDRDVMLYPARDLIFFQADVHGNLLTKQRISCLKAILESSSPLTIITTIDAFMDHLVPLQVIKESVITVENGTSIDSRAFSERLVGLGYERVPQVEAAGQFAARGGIFDIYPLTDENPVRIELWGEEVESIRVFDVLSQRSVEMLERVSIYPATETILTREQLRQGVKRIKQEAHEFEKKLREEFHTEEAHRVKITASEMEEKLQELGGACGFESYVHYFYENTVSFADYFDKAKTAVFLDEPGRLMEKGETIEMEFRESMSHRLEKGYLLPGQTDILFSWQSALSRLAGFPAASLSAMQVKQTIYNPISSFDVTVRSVNSYNNSFEALVSDLKRYKKNGSRVLLLSGSRTKARRLAEDFLHHDLNSFYTEDMDHGISPGEIMVAYGRISKGFEYPFTKFVVISESDIFGREKKKKKKRKRYEGQKIQSFTELNVGDYVVHESHGLGVYRGIEQIEVDGTVKDYMKIGYRDGGNLYVPATNLDLIQKFASSDAKAPKLNKLGTQEWSKTRSRVKGAVEVIARDLVELYATRQSEDGYRFSPDNIWQREFEEMFPFEETEDQILAIEATKKDMESTRIMDRLICGDVGYGKTEIALRAAFKAVQDEKQVVYLVPTTILAQQHYNTFVQRMKDYPIQIELLCRFRTASEQKKSLERLRRGTADIVIGTHRVLSKDVVLKDLGLLVIDEEQRFGVRHKEKIKKMKETVDVLTLTATPIPRTLHMSLVGIRDMSVLEEPPMDRMPIQTFVMEYNEEMVREAISRELARNGQVYYVYNRVNHIADVASVLQELVPEANVAFAHGQMKEHELERIMYGFINGEIDVLVSTTIIETGLDISNVNTIIIHDSDNMGLSQLYQLRGRVGRSNRTAYAFLMYRRDKMLKEVAEKRLTAIREFTELGSGFKIAMRDLEIRGAGNLLGERQHGHMEAVGYDLYCKMLNEAVKRLKGEARQEDEYETTVDMDVSAYIPDSYIRNEYMKLDMYKRIASIENDSEAEDLMEELIDRFGQIPKSVNNLLEISCLRQAAHNVFVTEVQGKEDWIKFAMYENARLDAAGMQEFLDAYHGTVTFKAVAKPYFLYKKPRTTRRSRQETRELLEIAKDIICGMQRLKADTAPMEEPKGTEETEMIQEEMK